jgi:hypothetical protein
VKGGVLTDLDTGVGVLARGTGVQKGRDGHIVWWEAEATSSVARARPSMSMRTGVRAATNAFPDTMRIAMKTMKMLACGLLLAGASALATAQSTPPADPATKPTGKDAMDSQMQLQKNKPSKTVSEADKAHPKSRPGGQAAMESQMSQQRNKPSPKVDKNAKAPPRPDASKMTPEERAAYRKDVVKDAKP